MRTMSRVADVAQNSARPAETPDTDGPIRASAITVTAHTYADLLDEELDNIAAALGSLSDF